VIPRLLVGDIHYTGEDINRDPLRAIHMSQMWVTDIAKEVRPEEIILLGDIFGAGAYESHVNISANHLLIFENWIYNLAEYCKVVRILSGNHDFIDRELQTSLLEYKLALNDKKIDVISAPIQGKDGVYFLPWNSKSVPESGCVISHLDYVDCMIRNYKMPTGMDIRTKAGPLVIYNGHYHNPSRQQIGNTTLFNVGSLVSHDFNDYEEKRYLYLIRDEVTRRFENPHTDIFVTIESMDDTNLITQLEQRSENKARTNLKIVCDEKTLDSTIRDKTRGFKSYRVQRTAKNVSVSRVSKEIQSSLPMLLEAYVDKSGTNLDKDRLKQVGLTLLGG